MTQKMISLTALFTALLWGILSSIGMPAFIYDPDGVLLIITLVLLDGMLAVIGGVSVIFAFKKQASWWITLSILAIPAAHALGSISEAPLNLVFFFPPIGVFAVMVFVKWGSPAAGGEKPLKAMDK